MIESYAIDEETERRNNYNTFFDFTVFHNANVDLYLELSLKLNNVLTMSFIYD
jgi:hypothetical protein